MSLFVSKDAEIVIKVYTCTVNGKMHAWTDGQLGQRPRDMNESDPEVTTHIIRFRVPSYGDNLQLLDSALRFNEEGKMSMSPTRLPYTRFVQLLKSWDFKDEKGEPVPATADNVLLLENAVAQLISNELDRQVSEV